MVIKNVIAVYEWMARQALARDRVTATTKDAERLSPEELGILAKERAAAANHVKPAPTKSDSFAGFTEDRRAA
jgi:hypothetical protein